MPYVHLLVGEHVYLESAETAERSNPFYLMRLNEFLRKRNLVLNEDRQSVRRNSDEEGYFRYRLVYHNRVLCIGKDLGCFSTDKENKAIVPGEIRCRIVSELEKKVRRDFPKAKLLVLQTKDGDYAIP